LKSLEAIQKSEKSAQLNAISSTYALSLAKACVDILAEEHPEMVRELYSDRGGDMFGMIRTRQILKDKLEGLRKLTGIHEDPRFEAILEWSTNISKAIEQLADTSWVRGVDVFTFSPNSIGVWTQTLGSAVFHSPMDINAQDAVNVSCVRDSGGAAHGPENVTGTATIFNGPSTLGPTIDMQPDRKYKVKWIQYFKTVDESYVSSAAVTYSASKTNGLKIVGSSYSNADIGARDWRVTFDVIDWVTEAKPVVVYYGPNEALRAVGFELWVTFNLPKTWESKVGADAYASVDIDDKWHYNWHTTSFGERYWPFNGTLKLEFQHDVTLTWTELMTPLGVSAPTVSIHQTIGDLSDKVATLTTETGNLTAAATATNNGMIGHLLQAGTWIHRGGALLSIIGNLIPEIGSVGSALMGISETMIGTLGAIDDFRHENAVTSVVNLLSGIGVIGDHAFGLIENSGLLSKGDKLIDFFMKEVDTFGHYNNAPADMSLHNAIAHGWYFGQRLGFTLGPLNSLGEALLAAAENGSILSTKITESSTLVPMHGSALFVFPRLDASQNVLDVGGNSVVVFIRRVIFIEFAGAGSGRVVNGKGAINWYEGIQYWDSTISMWEWSMSNALFRTNDAFIHTGSFSSRNDGYNEIFFPQSRRRYVLDEWTPAMPYTAINRFIQNYLSISGKYNLFKFNCQDVAKEMRTYSLFGKYPDWWERDEINNTIFDIIEDINDTHNSFSTSDMTEIRDGLLAADLDTGPFSRIE
jgi:hypothetical protein